MIDDRPDTGNDPPRRELAEPADPAELAEPAEFAESAESAEPAEFAESAQPAEPAEPAERAGSAGLPEPGAPVVGDPAAPADAAGKPAPDDAPPPAAAPDDADGAAVEPEGATDREPAGAPRWLSSVRAFTGRPSAAGAMIGVLLVVLGFALAAQVRSTNTDAQLSTARPDDLVRILTDLDAREERLRRELAELEESRRQLASGAQGRETALAEARRRAEVLGILAGTLPAEGTGLDITFAPRDQRIRADSILDAVEELRGAGAEAMQIAGSTGPPVRIVASTYFVDAGENIVVDGVQLTGPYTVLVIGDPQTMRTALNIPGGVVDSVRQRGGNVTMTEPEIVRITALHDAEPLKHARPVS